jgi:hypothetical protein
MDTMLHRPLCESRTLTVTINRNADDVYAFVSNPENLPTWAKAFCQSVMRLGASWVVKTSTGDVGLRFVEKNPFRVCDHYVTPAPGVEIYVPMRVLENGDGSEVIFTLFRQPEMTQDTFKRDLEMVERDLQTLKAVLES